MESVNQLNEQLHDCQRKYTDLLTNSSVESRRQNGLQQELTHLTNDKDKLQSKCQELEVNFRSSLTLSFSSSSETFHVPLLVKKEITISRVENIKKDPERERDICLTKSERLQEKQKKKTENEWVL